MKDDALQKSKQSVCDKEVHLQSSQAWANPLFRLCPKSGHYLHRNVSVYLGLISLSEYFYYDTLLHYDWLCKNQYCFINICFCAAYFKLKVKVRLTENQYRLLIQSRTPLLCKCTSKHTCKMRLFTVRRMEIWKHAVLWWQIQLKKTVCHLFEPTCL